MELHFDDLKNVIDCNRLRTHGRETMDGKLFVSFLSLILVSSLRSLISRVPPRDVRYWNWREVLSYSSSYGKCKFTGKYKDVYTVPTKGQRMIFKALGIPYFWKGKLVDSSSAIEDEEFDMATAEDDLATT